VAAASKSVLVTGSSSGIGRATVIPDPFFDRLVGTRLS
jgi:hypothetical protein